MILNLLLWSSPLLSQLSHLHTSSVSFLLAWVLCPQQRLRGQITMIALHALDFLSSLTQGPRDIPEGSETRCIDFHLPPYEIIWDWTFESQFLISILVKYPIHLITRKAHDDAVLICKSGHGPGILFRCILLPGKVIIFILQNVFWLAWPYMIVLFWFPISVTFFFVPRIVTLKLAIMCSDTSLGLFCIIHRILNCSFWKKTALPPSTWFRQ